MAISFDAALGIHDDALLYRARRAEVLANNIANADTPNFKAKDLEFSQILNQASEMTIKQAATSPKHQTTLLSPDLAADMMFRIPSQASVDGNTVEVQQEMARYTENALDYQTSFQLLNKKITGLKSAIKGE
ncbi:MULTISPECIES: flagellar basal body rod protein FlgB [unclassified Neptuniibacter]|jgi:flagellar basal-body rod protein FlgB|uniref:flagellar basal body rod protein FlgB n=1 Tax=unclassified Neptuniibacter TaxID=2630693 RepID=UPI0026E21588|nr:MULTISPECIES: flagellar basal body rod protein FlgB [unclassified Neptuniibacter]MDO6515447.1 flagellar basal body rod protein FlgB [Neptuniibacter sp. 2_MG-2023]MDO6595090.1 flagellar basal body rod protein FlgB [Neptuniibacter sp. 1_MG-2023]